MLIRRGSRGPEVVRIQEKVGADPDGIFGPQTEAMVRAYQEQHGLDPDGIVGFATLSVMFPGEFLEPGPEEPEPPAPPPVDLPDGLFEIVNHRLVGVDYVESNHYTRGVEINIDMVVEHYTAGSSFQGDLNWLTKPREQNRVSAHFLIGKDGRIVQLVPLNRRAWHAGVASFQGREGVNSRSVGIENHGFGREWPEAQIQANLKVIASIKAHYPAVVWIAGHDEVALPKGRKADPGPLFPWERFRDNQLRIIL